MKTFKSVADLSKLSRDDPAHDVIQDILADFPRAPQTTAIELLLFTGCRKGEVLSLKWEQVEEGRIFLPMTKNGQSRSVLLNAKAREVLESMWSQRKEGELDTDFVFLSRHGAAKGHIHDLRKPLDRVCEAAGIEGLRVHDLRHSFATIAVMSGASLYDVQKLLGHSDIGMTQRYAHMVDDSLQRATDGVSSAIEEAVSSKAPVYCGVAIVMSANHSIKL